MNLRDSLLTASEMAADKAEKYKSVGNVEEHYYWFSKSTAMRERANRLREETNVNV